MRFKSGKMDQPLLEEDLVVNDEECQLKIVERTNIKPKRRRKKRRDLWSRRSKPRKLIKQSEMQSFELESYIDPQLMTSHIKDTNFGDYNWMTHGDSWKQPTLAEDEYFQKESLTNLEATVGTPRGSRDCFLTDGLPSEPFPDFELSHFNYEPCQSGTGIWCDEVETMRPETIEDQFDVDILTPDIKIEQLEEEPLDDQIVINEDVIKESNPLWLPSSTGFGTASIDSSTATTTRTTSTVPSMATAFLSVTPQYHFGTSNLVLVYKKMSALPPASMSLRPRRVVHVTCAVPINQPVRRQSLSAVFLKKSENLDTFDVNKPCLDNMSKSEESPKKKTYWVSESAMYNSVKHVARRNRQKMVSPGMASTLEKRKSPDHNLRERERRCFIQTKFQDLRAVLGLKSTASKINVLKEAQLECCALKIMSEDLEKTFKETLSKKERLIAELSKLMDQKSGKCMSSNFQTKSNYKGGVSY